MTRTQIDNHRLMYHPARVSDWLEGKRVYPIYVEIGPTNRCNHRCAFCALDWMKHGGSDIDLKMAMNALEEMGLHGVKSVMFAGEGEPFLYAGISELIQQAKRSGLDVAVTTNGALFTQEKIRSCLGGISWMRVSLDAGTPKTYAELHGVSEKEYEKTLDNLSAAVRFKKEQSLDSTIGVQVLILPQNRNELLEIAVRVKSIGVDNIQFKPYSHHPFSHNSFEVDYRQLMDMEKKLRELEDDTFQVHYRKNTIERIMEGRDYAECYGLPFFALIDSRGDVIPCNMYYNRPEFAYGNLYQSSFSEIWESDRRQEVVRRIAESGTEICRQGCRLDAVNRYLHQLKHPHPHVNFI